MFILIVISIFVIIIVVFSLIFRPAARFNFVGYLIKIYRNKNKLYSVIVEDPHWDSVADIDGEFQTIEEARIAAEKWLRDPR